MRTHDEGLERLRKDILLDAAKDAEARLRSTPCKHILVPGQTHCAVCGERIVFGRV